MEPVEEALVEAAARVELDQGQQVEEAKASLKIDHHLQPLLAIRIQKSLLLKRQVTGNNLLPQGKSRANSSQSIRQRLHKALI